MPGPANSSGSGQLPSLCGRRRECAVLDELLEQVRRGRGTVLVLRGEARVGKTALLEYVAGRAQGCRLARVTGCSRRWSWPLPGCISCARRC